MDDSEPTPQTAAEHIDALNECDAKIVRLLRIHADAVRCLSAEGGSSKLDADTRRAIFRMKIAEFTKLLGEVRETQHSSINALRDTANGPSGRRGEGAEQPRAILGELGDLDVSFLNSQNDDVGKQIEAEQWEVAAQLCQRLLREKQRQTS